MMNAKKTENSKIDHEHASDEVLSFVKKWAVDVKGNDEKIKEDFGIVIKAVKSGRLVFNEKLIPSYNLKDPILSEKKTFTIEKVNFRTRIRPSTMADISDGLNVEKQSLRLSTRFLSYIIDVPVRVIDKFEKEDYTVIRDLASVFL